MASTRFGRINFNHITGLDLVQNLLNTGGLGQIDLDPFAAQRFYCPAAHTAADDTIDFVFRQLVHGMTRAVIMVGVPVLDNRDFVCVCVTKGEERGRTEMVTYRVLESGVSFGWYASQHDNPHFAAGL